MIVKYGNFAHPQDEVLVTIQRTPTFDEQKKAIGYTEKWNLGGQLLASSSAAITTALNALVAAYSVNGRDLKLLHDDGTTLTAHYMLSGQSRGGTRVVEGPSYLEGGKGQYANHRSYSIAVEADFLSSAASNLISFHEEIEIVGSGGPMFSHMPVIAGIWPKIQTTTHSAVRMVQRGQAVGLITYPYAFVPPPIWPGDVKGWESKIVKGGPDSINGNFTNYRLAWEYPFEANTPRDGNPNAY